MKTTFRRITRLAAFGLAAGVALGAQASPTVLAMDSLPMAQGWTYDICWWGCHVPTATDAWTVDGTALSLNAYAGATGASLSGFYLPGAVDSALPFTIDSRLKITSGINPFFYLAAHTATNSVIVSLSTSMLRIYAGAGNVDVALDATSFHDYQIAATPGSMVTVKVDGTTVYNGSEAWLNIDPHSNASSLEFGDGTSGANGTAVISSYRFNQTASVPEPSGLALVAAGLAALRWSRRAAQAR